MLKVLFSSPLFLLYLLYVAALLVAVLWPDTARPQRRSEGPGPLGGGRGTLGPRADPGAGPNPRRAHTQETHGYPNHFRT